VAAVHGRLQSPLILCCPGESGAVSDYSGYGYDGWSTDVAFGAGDPLFGDMPGTQEARAEEMHSYTHGTGQKHGYGQEHDTGQWPGYGTGHTQIWEAGPHTVYGDTSLHQQIQTAEAGGAYAPKIEAHETDETYETHETGTYRTTTSETGTYGTGAYETTAFGTGTLENRTFENAAFENGSFGTGMFETGTGEAVNYQTGTYEHAEVAGAGGYETKAYVSWAAHEPGTFESGRYQPATYDPEAHEEPGPYAGPYEPVGQGYGPEPDGEPAGDPGPAPRDATTAAIPRSRAANRGGNRRRRPARRSALFSVAVPSVAVMGVAACAAAAVAVSSDRDEPTTTQADDTSASTTAVSSNLDRQLAGVSRNADDFADRASRTQERLDLKERQAAERHRKAAEAARREALRPKFFLPVAQRGLSAYFGQAGVNWMSVHTGIDFPVSYGTPVRAATDGTVRTQWNPSYGNMAIVTAANGTETWYCHLSSTKIRSGSVKAGDVIAYSGNSGNSTGPHLHFEVHPGGSAAIDPLNWLLAKGLDPR
jgi:murein DD-endopeptidase MepM/ murein hydrolase activator NlpD